MTQHNAHLLPYIERRIERAVHDGLDGPEIEEAINLLDLVHGDSDAEPEPGEEWLADGSPLYNWTDSCPVYELCSCCGHLERIEGEYV